MALVPERFTLYAQPLPEIQLPRFGLTKQGIRTATRNVLGRWDQYYRIVPLERPRAVLERPGELMALEWANWRLSIVGETPQKVAGGVVWLAAYLVPSINTPTDDDDAALYNLWHGFTVKGSRVKSKGVMYKGMRNFLVDEIDAALVPLPA